MRGRTMRKKDLNNKGFTLVELIVVLVILAVLAAVLVPTLLGYIDDAKEKQSRLDAKSILNATQSELTKLYAKNNSNQLALGTNVIPDNGSKSNKNGDTDLRGQPFAEKILDFVEMNGDNKPFLLMIGLGSNWETNSGKGNASLTTKHDKYRILYLVYIKEKGDEYLYYYNGEWTRISPHKNGDFSEFNFVQNGELKGKRIQYYLLAYQGTYNYMKNDFWSNLNNETL